MVDGDCFVRPSSSCVRARALSFKKRNIAPSQNTAERTSWPTRVVAVAAREFTVQTHSTAAAEGRAHAKRDCIRPPTTGSHGPMATGWFGYRGVSAPPPTAEPCEKVSGTRVPFGGWARVAARFAPPVWLQLCRDDARTSSPHYTAVPFR